jgi:cell division protein FtsI (penicillin-binding protein 3)
MEALRVRIVFSCVFGLLILSVTVYKLCDIMVIRNATQKISTRDDSDDVGLKSDILDRNGEVLATCVTTASCYADPSVIIDINEASEMLSKIPGMPGATKIREKLNDKQKHFVWIARHITPQIQQKIMDIGIPGIHFQKDYKRVYPYGFLFSHVVGCTDIDSAGASGIERSFDNRLRKENLSLTLDLRIQSIVYEELKEAVEKYRAIGGNAIVMSTRGEVIAMVSLPDFEPNSIKQKDIDSMFNRNTLGVYEPGSIFKILNTAIALESGRAKLNSMYDASAPIKIGKFTVTDFRGKNRILTLAEAFVFSSNLASIKIAQQFGTRIQKKFMKKFGVLEKSNVELLEIGAPLSPKMWQESTLMTISYGYGIALSPLQLLASVTSLVNRGERIYPTLVGDNVRYHGEKVVSDSTALIMRDLMRAAVLFGTAKKADVEGAEIFGKTGTAYKNSGKGYGTDGNRSKMVTFVGGFPKSKPQYMMIVMLDEPHPTDETYGYSTAGWNAAPTAGKIFKRIVPVLCNYENMQNENKAELMVTKYLDFER